MTWASITYTFSPSTPARSAQVNQNFSDLVDAINIAMPSNADGHGMILWSGQIADIPSGWYFCDGSNGTPDTRGRFIRGAGGAYSVGDTGGNETIDLSHAHNNDPHSHAGYVGYTTITIASVANHRHKAYGDGGDLRAAIGLHGGGGNDNITWANVGASNPNEGGASIANPNYNIDGTADSMSGFAGFTPVYGYVSDAGGHTHNNTQHRHIIAGEIVTMDTQLSPAQSILPPFINLAWIMKS